MWHQFLPMAVLNYNTSYHSSLGCEPSKVFHGRVPYKVLDFKYGLKRSPEVPTNNEIAEGILRQTKEIVNQAKQSLMQSYVRHKLHYDKKASANPLVANDYCYALHPKAHSQTRKMPFRDYLWTGPYIVVKTLPNNNYSIRKLQTNLTQILHRIRLRPFTSTHKLPDISILPKDFQQDSEVAIQQDDLYALPFPTTHDPPSKSTNPNPMSHTLTQEKTTCKHPQTPRHPT